MNPMCDAVGAAAAAADGGAPPSLPAPSGGRTEPKPKPAPDAGDAVGAAAAAAGAPPSLPPPRGGRTDRKPKPAPDASAAAPPRLPSGARTAPNTDAAHGASTFTNLSPVPCDASASVACPPPPPPSGGRTDPKPNVDADSAALPPVAVVLPSGGRTDAKPFSTASDGKAAVHAAVSLGPPPLTSGGFTEPQTVCTEPTKPAPVSPATAPPAIPSGLRTCPNTDTAGAAAPGQDVWPDVSSASPEG